MVARGRISAGTDRVMEAEPEEARRQRARAELVDDPPPPRYTSGVFARYRALVGSASEGNVLLPHSR